MPRLFLSILAGLSVARTASAEAVLSIPLRTDASILSATYSCAGGDPFLVQYVEAGGNSLALVPLDGEDRVFVRVMSASGARYASGPLIWWSKGDSATLSNEMEEGSSTECVTQAHPSAP